MKIESKRKVEIIDYLRGFAALYVVIHHFLGFTELKGLVPEVIHFPFRFGQEVVLLFFIMSGFVIYTANQKTEEINFKQYFLKRVIRIYPIFFLTLILSFVVLIINKEEFQPDDFKDLIGNIFMLQDTGNKPGAIVYPFLQNYPLWSLSYEWWFYMIFFPLSLYLHKTSFFKNIPGIYLILIISAVSWIIYLIIPNHLLLILSHLIIWWAGIYIATLYFSGRGISAKNLSPVYFSLIGMTLLSSIPLIKAVVNKEIFTVNDYPFIDFRHFLFSFLIIAVGNILYVIKSDFFIKIIRPFGRLANISYALYCVHFPIILLKLPFIENIYLLCFIKLILVFMVSYLFEMVLQPVFYRLIKRNVQTNLSVSNG